MSDMPATIRELVDRAAAKFGHGLKRETVSKALNVLLDTGHVDRLDQGQGKPALWIRAARSEGI